MWKTASLVSLAALSSSIVLAEDPPVAQNPPAKAEVVVTATRETREINSVPNAVIRLDVGQDVTGKGVRTTPELLDGAPSVFVQKTAYGQGSPYVRGFTGFRNLLMIDGVRLNNSVFRDGPNQYWSTVDPFSLDRAELVMGPASVLYGSDAIGGSLNVMPIAPPAFNPEKPWSGRFLYRGASAEDSHVGRLSFGDSLSENLGFVGGISVKTFGDLRGGRDVGVQKHTGYDEQDWDFRGDYTINDDSTLSFCHQSVRQDDVWRTHKTRYGIDWKNLEIGDDKVHSYDQGRDLSSVKLRKENMRGLLDGTEITLSHQLQSEDLLRVRKNDSIDRQGFDVSTLGNTFQFTSDSDWGRWVYGTEYYRDQIESYSRKYKPDGTLGKTEIQGPVADDSTYDSIGVFAQDTLSLMNEAFELIPGARYTRSQADAQKVKDPITGKRTSLDDEWSSVCGSLRVLRPLTPDRRQVAFAGIAQGFRAPNLSDLTRLDIARSNEIETPAPDLDPENYIAYELGLKLGFDKLTSHVTAYHTDIDGMIVRAPTGRQLDGAGEVTKLNAGDGYVQGIEMLERYAFDDSWSVWIQGALTDGEVDGYPGSTTKREREYLSRLMPPTAQTGLRWQSRNAARWCELSADMADKADKLSASDKRDTQRVPPGGTPGYAILNARAGARLLRHLTLNLSLENIMDTDYRVHGSGVNEPGRNLILTAISDF